MSWSESTLVRIGRLGLVALCSLLVGCPPTGGPASLTLTWSVVIQTVSPNGPWVNVPVNAGNATVDPTANLQVRLWADGPNISTMTLTGTGNVNCEARVSAGSGNAATLQFMDSTLALGTDNEVVSPPATPHLALLNFQRGNVVEDIGVIRCNPNPTNVGQARVFRYYDAWSGTLNFSGSANGTQATPLVITLNPPAP